MLINVRHDPTAEVITVKRMGYFESQLRFFVRNLHLSQEVDRVLLENGRIVWVGGKEYPGYPGEPADYLNMDTVRDMQKQVMEGF